MRHQPVLLSEVQENLALRPGSLVVDATLGDGGHAEMILQQIGPTGRLLAIDADPEAILRAKQYLYVYQEQILFVRENFARLGDILQEQNWPKTDAILADLGWSSVQFSERGRGFSFLKTGEPLDMRFNPQPDRLTAADLVNTLSESELQNILWRYGEEKAATYIARAIGQQRKKQKIETVGQLLAVIPGGLAGPGQRRIHPATRTFQALRIAVNQELEKLEAFLPQAIEALTPGGRLAIISFHSLEDRLVKHFIQKQTKTIKIINKKPIIPSPAEIATNPRARSAKLRVIEKI